MSQSQSLSRKAAGMERLGSDRAHHSAKATTTRPIDVRPLGGWKDRATFVALPYRLHRSDPHWIPPLKRDIYRLISTRRNPFFEHGEACFWLAWRDGVPVGRISAQINHQHLAIHHDETGNFGMLEAIDDQAVFAALLRTAEDWLRHRGMRRILGPYSLSMNDEIGVLVSGFDTAPFIGMAHTPAYYAARLEAEGYFKIKDVIALRAALSEMMPENFDRLDRVTARLRASGRLGVRFLNTKRFADDVRLGLDIYNEAWSNNWGFLPVGKREADHLIAQMTPIVSSQCVVFGLADGKEAAMLVTLPNINELIADLSGRLLPLGWLRLLWRLHFRKIRSVRVVLAGIRRHFEGSATSTALLALMLAELGKVGWAERIETVEFSWILEDNKRSLEGSYALGARLAKVYRIFAKGL